MGGEPVKREARQRAAAEQSGVHVGLHHPLLLCTGRNLPRGKCYSDTLTGVCATLSLIEVRAPQSGLQGAFLSLTRSIVRPNDRIQQTEVKWVCLGLSG